MIRFIEVVKNSSAFTLSEVWINENYVVSVREAAEYRRMLTEGVMPPDLDETHSFTKVVTNNGHITESHVVVGSPATVAGRLTHGKKTLLKG